MYYLSNNAQINTTMKLGHYYYQHHLHHHHHHHDDMLIILPLISDLFTLSLNHLYRSTINYSYFNG